MSIPPVNPSASYPTLSRPRRLRRTAVMRDMVAETRVHPSHLMQPYFVQEGDNRHDPIAAMPGVGRLTIDRLQREVERGMQAGLRQVMLFGVSHAEGKDACGSAAAHDDSLIARAVRTLKQTFGQALLVSTDICLCGYTDHGHCGVLKDGHVDNDASLAPLVAMACAHARAGADMVAPSDMMDHRVGAMRCALDAMGCQNTALMSYSVKYASAYYGPFRDAAGSAPGQGDRRGYQMDPRNVREATREALLDVAEGADMLMVKPAMAYLDIIALLRANTTLPVACYNVSGEYSMVKAAALQGFIDEASVVQENFTAMRRAGADLIITYHATDALEGGWLTR